MAFNANQTQDSQAERNPREERAQHSEDRENARDRSERTRRQRAGGDLFSNLANIRSGFVAQGNGGQYLSKFRAVADTAIREILNEDLHADLYVISAADNDLKFSLLTVGLHFKADPGTMAFHTLLLEGTGSKLEPRTITVDGQPMTINRTTDQAVDERCVSTVNNIIKRNNTDVTCWPAAYQVVPSTVDPERDIDTVTEILRSACLACVSKIQAVTDSFMEINMANIPENHRLEIQLSTSQHPVISPVGSPIRASAIVDVAIAPEQTRNRNREYDSVHDDNDTIHFARVTGFVNPIWAFDASQRSFRNQRSQQDEPKLAAEFVITSIATPYSASPAAILMAIAATHAISDDDRWWQLLMPQGAVVDKNARHNVGWLNIIADVFDERLNGIYGREAMPDPKDLQSVSEFFTLLFQEGMVLSIDCEMNGPNSWQTNLFVAAAQNDPAAINIIFNSLNELTDGIFGEIWDKEGDDEPIFTSMMRVPLGQYLEKSEYRDIRDFDLTEISRVFANNPEQIHEFNATFLSRVGQSDIRQFATRQNFIAHAASNQCEFTGEAQRLTFGATFRSVLSKAYAELNVPTNISTPMVMDRYSRGQQAPSYLKDSLLRSTATFRNRFGRDNGGRGNRSYSGLAGAYGRSL